VQLQRAASLDAANQLVETPGSCASTELDSWMDQMNVCGPRGKAGFAPEESCDSNATETATPKLTPDEPTSTTLDQSQQACGACGADFVEVGGADFAALFARVEKLTAAHCAISQSGRDRGTEAAVAKRGLALPDSSQRVSSLPHDSGAISPEVWHPVRVATDAISRLDEQEEVARRAAIADCEARREARRLAEAAARAEGATGAGEQEAASSTKKQVVKEVWGGLYRWLEDVDEIADEIADEIPTTEPAVGGIRASDEPPEQAVDSSSPEFFVAPIRQACKQSVASTLPVRAVVHRLCLRPEEALRKTHGELSLATAATVQRRSQRLLGVDEVVQNCAKSIDFFARASLVNRAVVAADEGAQRGQSSKLRKTLRARKLARS